MKELDHSGASYAQKWVWEKPRRRSTIRTILVAVLIGLSFLFALLIIEELTGFMVLDNEHSRHDTDLQKKIYWHSQYKD